MRRWRWSVAHSRARLPAPVGCCSSAASRESARPRSPGPSPTKPGGPGRGWRGVRAHPREVRRTGSGPRCCVTSPGAIQCPQPPSDYSDGRAGDRPPTTTSSGSKLHDAVTQVVGDAAGDLPLVIVLDDLHWADEPSLGLLDAVARGVGGRRVLLLGTYREPRGSGPAPPARGVRGRAHARRARHGGRRRPGHDHHRDRSRRRRSRDTPYPDRRQPSVRPRDRPVARRARKRRRLAAPAAGDRCRDTASPPGQPRRTVPRTPGT